MSGKDCCVSLPHPRKDAMVINAMSHLVYQTVRYIMSPECLSSISSVDEKLELSGTFYNFLQLFSSLLSLHSVEFSAKPSAFWTWIRSHSCFCSKRQMTRKFMEIVAQIRRNWRDWLLQFSSHSKTRVVPLDMSGGTLWIRVGCHT